MAETREHFNNPINTDPDKSKRLAFGKSGAITENMTLSQFIVFMFNNLASFFLQPSNYLGEFNEEAEKEAARVNLWTYSRDEVDALVDFVDTGWKNGVKVSSDVDTASFICKVAQWGKVVTGNGQIKLTSAPGVAVLFTLPNEVAYPSIDVYFCACDADGSTSENIELKIGAGTRNVYCEDSSEDRVSSFNFSYIAT